MLYYCSSFRPCFHFFASHHYFLKKLSSFTFTFCSIYFSNHSNLVLLCPFSALGVWSCSLQNQFPTAKYKITQLPLLDFNFNWQHRWFLKHYLALVSVNPLFFSHLSVAFPVILTGFLMPCKAQSWGFFLSLSLFWSKVIWSDARVGRWLSAL